MWMVHFYLCQMSSFFKLLDHKMISRSGRNISFSILYISFHVTFSCQVWSYCGYYSLYILRQYSELGLLVNCTFLQTINYYEGMPQPKLVEKNI